MSLSTLAIIDYGMGNLHSIAKALQHVAPDNVRILVTSDNSLINEADRIVFPGVGAMRDCMYALKEAGLPELIRQQVQQRKPLLGICLGMQALLDESEEAPGVPCLSLVPGRVVRFEDNLHTPDGDVLKIPHMGWNRVRQQPHPLWQDIPQQSWFYFVHSFYAVPENAASIAATTEYPDDFACALQQENLFAVQFHPEKSHQQGLKLLENFIRWDGTL